LEEIKSEHHVIETTRDLQRLCAMVRKPRTLMMLVPAGKPVDAVLDGLVPHLEAGDLLIDSGNSHYKDTDRRAAWLGEKGLLYLGMGMSGGEEGARHGPSLMPGGDASGYEQVKRIMETVAAHVEGVPCVAYMGSGSAGHYVKMVHNGIEYALMQLIAETYDLLRRGLGLRPETLQQIYARWNQGVLNSYLMQITADIFAQVDERTGRPLVDLILDKARQKGTGEWTVTDALQIQVPTLAIDMAVMMRHMSGYKEEREAASLQLQGPAKSVGREKQQFIDQLENALYCGAIVAYAQGMALLKQASEIYDYNLKLHTVARVWTGGCIIRAALLEKIQEAYQNNPELVNMLLAPAMAQEVQQRQSDWRQVINTGIDSGIPVPALSATLAYWDAYRSGSLPANLIMAQRDYFGAHTYERVDAPGTFHCRWDARQRRFHGNKQTT
jgi:6-phosphogluconate dehydrogenase